MDYFFVTYLEAALRDLRPPPPHTPKQNKQTQTNTETQPKNWFTQMTWNWFLTLKLRHKNSHPSYTKSWKHGIQWSMKVKRKSQQKTWITRIEKHKKTGKFIKWKWGHSKKKNPAQTAFIDINEIWIRKVKINERKRIPLYETLVTPILTYNSGMWGLTNTNLNSQDTFIGNNSEKCCESTDPKR